MTAAHANGLPNRPHAGVAGTLLAVNLSRRAGNFAARQRAHRSLPLVRVIIDQRLLEQLLAHAPAELGFIDLDRVGLLAGLVVNGDFDHDACHELVASATSSSLPLLPSLPPAWVWR